MEEPGDGATRQPSIRFRHADMLTHYHLISETFTVTAAAALSTSQTMISAIELDEELEKQFGEIKHRLAIERERNYRQ
jgi:hypothetical protein